MSLIVEGAVPTPLNGQNPVHGAAPARSAPALAAHGLSVCYGQRAPRRAALQDVTLNIEAGRWTAIAGPNGAGKSTLLKALAGLLPHGGQLHLLGQPLAAHGARQRARRMVWLGQNETGADDLSVWDIAMLGRLPHQGWLAAPSAADVRAVRTALAAVQALDWRQRPLGQLSGGERQRVLLARALATQAEVLLMDEPLTNLDPPHQADWVGLVRQLVAQGKTVVSVLHELNVALAADDLLVIDQGRVAHHGPAGDAASHRALESVFGQRVRVQALGGQWIAVLPHGQEAQ